MSKSTDLYGSEYDSEDDEGFFLTPVLHYDISNKIKEANKILFEENARQQIETKEELTNRRVTFCEELVSYAPNVEATTTTTPSDDEDDASIKEELEKIEATATSESVEKLCEINEIIEEIDNQMILEQEPTIIAKKSLLELDPPLTTSYKPAVALELPKVNVEIEEIIEPAESVTNDTFSLEVGVVARKHIQQELKEQKKVSHNHKPKSKASAPKFNYKTCCEYQQARLPQYKGHISEYGLSLRERERLLQLHKRQERNFLEQESRIQTETMQRLSANEKAFSAWLHNKCRHAPNRTRNMFDCPKTTTKTSSNNKIIRNT